MSNASRPRRLLALATDNWLARSYLAVFAASVGVTFLFPESAFAPSPLLLTAPLSFLGVLLPFGPGTEGGGALEVLAIGLWAAWLLLCALLNAAVLGALVARTAATAAPRARNPFRRISGPSRQKGPGTRAERRGRRTTRALLAPAVDNWLARGYLAVVAASLGFFLIAAYVLPDPGFAGIWPLMTTAPLSILALLVSAPADYSSLTWLSPLVFTAATALSGLFNAVLLGLLARRLRGREPRPTTT